MTYASTTSVPVDRSHAEIKRILAKYKATSFAFGEGEGIGMVTFEIAQRRMKFLLPIPQHGKERGAGRGGKDFMTQSQVAQLTRSRWRALALAIKAKLECVASGIASIEQEFLAYTVLPNGRTVGEIAIPQIARSYETNEMPPLLEGPR